MENVKDGQAYAHDCEIEIGNLQSLLKFLRRARDKAAEDCFPCKEHDNGNDHRGDQGDQKRGFHTLADAVCSACPQVLAHIGDHGIAVGGGRYLQHSVELVGGGKSGNKEDAEAVDYKLYDHSSDGNNGILEGHGKAQHKQTHRQSFLKPEIGRGKGQDVNPADIVETIKAGNKLGDQGGRSRAADAKAKAQDKE